MKSRRKRRTAHNLQSIRQSTPRFLNATGRLRHPNAIQQPRGARYQPTTGFRCNVNPINMVWPLMVRQMMLRVGVIIVALQTTFLLSVGYGQTVRTDQSKQNSKQTTEQPTHQTTKSKSSDPDRNSSTTGSQEFPRGSHKIEPTTPWPCGRPNC